MINPDTPRRRAEDRDPIDTSHRSDRIGEDVCETVLEAVRRANRSGTPITTWDLPKVTGLPLHAASVAVRTLEFGRQLVIDDNPSDPFGATLQACDEGTSGVETEAETRRVA